MPRGPTDDHLLDAAAAEAAQHGLNGFSLQAVADTAASTKMTLRSRFGDRQGLVEATVVRSSDHWARTAEQAASEHPDTPAPAVMEATAGLLGPPHHPRIVLLALLEAPQGSTARDAALACTQRLRTALAPDETDADELLAQLVGATAIAIAEDSTEPLHDAAEST